MTRTEIDELALTLRAEVVQTSVSYVLLGQEEVWKIKQPVVLSYLDYGTPEKRRHACEKEYLLNRRYAPDLYKKVVAISYTDHQWAVLSDTASATAQDYAVVMKRMDTRLGLDVCLKAGEVTSTDMQELAAVVVAFHRQAPTCPQRGIIGEGIFRNILDVISLLPPGHEVRTLIHAVCDDASRFLNKFTPLLRKRWQEGWVRDVHGDLHAGNVFLTHPPVLFDGLEFRDDLRQIDVLSEVAFLTMDLQARGFPNLANDFRNHYQTLWPEALEGAEWLLPFFELYRANVRTKVSFATYPSDLDKALAAAAPYLALMHEKWQYIQPVLA